MSLRGPRMAPLIALAMTSLPASPAQDLPLPDAAAICGPNAYIDAYRVTAEEEIITCACQPGYRQGTAGCAASLPMGVTENLPALIPHTATGRVQVYYQAADGVLSPVSSKHLFQANRIVLGPDARLVAYLGDIMRLDIGGGTDLALGPNDPASADSFTILSLKGSLRFDNHFSDTDKSWLRDKMRYVKAWYKKLSSRRFRVRTPSGSFAVRGSDVDLTGGADGTLHLRVQDGIVDVMDTDGKNLFTLSAGQEALLPPDGLPRLRKASGPEATARVSQAPM